ncbi:MAG: hypothetical protein ABL960_12605 [Nitrospira sp.]
MLMLLVHGAQWHAWPRGGLLVVETHPKQADVGIVLKDHPYLEIHAVGSPYDGLVVDHWWKDRDSARQVVLETAKWLLFWVYTEF